MSRPASSAALLTILAPSARQRLCLGGRAVPDRDVVARLHQQLGHGKPHAAGADPAYARRIPSHAWSPIAQISYVSRAREDRGPCSAQGITRPARSRSCQRRQVVDRASCPQYWAFAGRVRWSCLFSAFHIAPLGSAIDRDPPRYRLSSDTSHNSQKRAETSWTSSSRARPRSSPAAAAASARPSPGSWPRRASTSPSSRATGRR